MFEQLLSNLKSNGALSDNFSIISPAATEEDARLKIIHIFFEMGIFFNWFKTRGAALHAKCRRQPVLNDH